MNSSVPARTSPADLLHLGTACSQCNLRELCLPVELSEIEIRRLDTLIETRRKIKRGQYLYRAGSPFGMIYAVKTGFFKNDALLEDGRYQVTGFQMAGELIGLDGIGSGVHTCNSVALEDSEVCAVPFTQLEQLTSEMPALQRQLHRIMSREIVRDHGVMLLLGIMRAEERLAAFLLNLSQRFLARGYSPLDFHLRMTREEIGSYLGLKLETVSRTFSHFQELGMISVQHKHVTITDVGRIRAMLSRQSGHP